MYFADCSLFIRLEIPLFIYGGDTITIAHSGLRKIFSFNHQINTIQFKQQAKTFEFYADLRRKLAHLRRASYSSLTIRTTPQIASKKTTPPTILRLRAALIAQDRARFPSVELDAARSTPRAHVSPHKRQTHTCWRSLGSNRIYIEASMQRASKKRTRTGERHSGSQHRGAGGERIRELRRASFRIVYQCA